MKRVRTINDIPYRDKPVLLNNGGPYDEPFWCIVFSEPENGVVYVWGFLGDDLTVNFVSTPDNFLSSCKLIDWLALDCSCGAKELGINFHARKCDHSE